MDVQVGPNEDISIHALREEGDLHWHIGHNRTRQFLSTPSARRATRSLAKVAIQRVISIHALREEGDYRTWAYCFWDKQFLSTPSARRATTPIVDVRTIKPISIHALREEGDRVLPEWRVPATHFYPRPPRGGRPSRCCCGDVGPYFYPRPPRGGRRW